MHGKSITNSYIEAPLLKQFGINEKIKFFLFPQLKSHDGILGHPAIKELKLKIDFSQNIISNHQVSFPFFDKKSQVVIHNLSKDQETGVQEILSKHKNIQLWPNQKLTANTNIRAEIKTATEEPVYANYPIPFTMRPIAGKLIQEMLDNNIIRPSRSPYNAPIKIVEKKSDGAENKKYRLTVNFQKLNTQVISDKYPFPAIEDILAQLGGKKYFTTLDLIQGFYQIPIKEQDIKKTAFSGPTGKYEFLRLPMGLKNSPAIFQRMLDDILRDEIGKSCFVYIDDIICFSDSFENHLKDLDKILSKLEAANLKIHPEKCAWAKTSLKYLGFIVTENGIKPDPEKTETILRLAFPDTLKKLKSFIGMVNYYRKFIKDCSKILKPLNQLTNLGQFISKNQSEKIKIQQTQEALESFEKIKRALTSVDVLSFPDINKPYLLTTDASNTAIGAVLAQKDGRQTKPIQFLSRALSKTEQNYSTIEKELLAITWAVDHLNNYLYGNKVTIFTDHKPLTFTLKSNNNNDKLTRWISRINQCDNEIIYKPGKDNVVADFLSRTELNTLTDVTQHSALSDNFDLIGISPRPLNTFRNQIIIKKSEENSQTFKILFKSHKRHIVLRKSIEEENFMETLKTCIDFNIENAILAPENWIDKIQKIVIKYFKVKKHLIFTQSLLEDITDPQEQFDTIKTEHERAHRGIQENYAHIKKQFFWPSMLHDIKNFVNTCKTCKSNKYDRNPPKNFIGKTPIPSQPGEIIHIDLFQIFKQTFLSSICKLTKYATLIPIKSKSVEDIKEALMEIIFKYRKPNTIVMDNEPAFQSFVLENLFRNLDINIYFIPAAHSESNGQIERLHSTVLEIIRCKNKDWDDFSAIQKVQIATDLYNSSIHSVTRVKPADGFFPVIKNLHLEKILEERGNLFKNLKGKLEESQKKVIIKNNEDGFKKFTKGELIFVKNKQIKSKTKERYLTEIVEKDLNTKVKTKNGKMIHKSNIKS
jgi:hypothetical protein